MDIRQLQQWNPDALEKFGGTLGAFAGRIENVGVDVGAAGDFGEVWIGAASDTAAGNIARTGKRIADQADSYRKVGRCASDCAPRLRLLRGRLDETASRAAELGLAIGPDGTVMPADSADADDIRAQIAAILESAAALDREAAAALAEVAVDLDVGGTPFGRIHTQGPAIVPVPGPGTDPREVMRWWDMLGAQAREHLLTTRPGEIGGLDGIPAADRDRANRALLETERVRLERVAERLATELDGNIFGGLFSNADAGLEQTRRKLAALDAVADVLERGDRQLLALDLSGREAMAAVAVGDVDTADHVAVFTPGAGSTVQGNLAGYDEQIAAVRSQAERGLESSGRPDRSVAAVTWLNYQAPQWGWGLAITEQSPVSDLAATRAAPGLARFLTSLDAREDNPNVTAIGHSYGALVTGMALAQGAPADAAVFLGAPGIGTDDIHDLGLAPGSAFLVEADRDPVADVGTFGGDPSFLDGLTRLSSDPGIGATGEAYRGSIGHSAYLTPGTTSSYNVALVVAGLAGQAVR
ncbi:alpha/beta hydrolase family protein [Rhodococcus sp. HM1]|uniref:alpha/beta hydrolase n=1 Tax=Rhodococcus sp. HM1 TaxID=2937759 RepID=UPI00200AC20B|nr:alpha/beta hydrolase [Rhodococcus sp. HM1]MCK8671822.1 alpha/beta hydrolase family protein [Rhodococcus sp. HM1]